MRILVTGATGFIGRALVPVLLSQDHSILVWTRSPARARGRLGAEVDIVDAASRNSLVSPLARCDAVVNLAGAPVLGGRWTARRRRMLHDSRAGFTGRLVRALADSGSRPHVLVSASAIGYYGARGTEPLLESSPSGTGFLAGLCRDWELAAQGATAMGLRVALIRIGVVLGRDGGALAAMLPPFKLGVGGPTGSGRQYLSWIHLHDLVRILATAVADDRFEGPINAVAPEPLQSRAFASALGVALRRPAVLPLPALALRAVLGEASSVLLGSLRVEPAALRRLGFVFRYPSIGPALSDIVGGATISFRPVFELPETGRHAAGAAYLATHCPTHQLRTTTIVKAPLETTFAFFSQAANLGLLTPASMHFTIRTSPPGMGENVAIEYRLRVAGIPITWRSRIVQWKPGAFFVDLQEKGPYRSWWHEHAFRPDDGKTMMEDRVYFAAPLGGLGRLANRFFIMPMLRRIFQYRADVIRLRFSGPL